MSWYSSWVNFETAKLPLIVIGWRIFDPDPRNLVWSRLHPELFRACRLQPKLHLQRSAEAPPLQALLHGPPCRQALLPHAGKRVEGPPLSQSPHQIDQHLRSPHLELLSALLVSWLDSILSDSWLPFHSSFFNRFDASPGHLVLPCLAAHSQPQDSTTWAFQGWGWTCERLLWQHLLWPDLWAS